VCINDGEECSPGYECQEGQCVAVCDGPYEIDTLWRVIWEPLEACLPLCCDGPDGGIKHDDCGNDIEIMCAQSDGTGDWCLGGCAWRYFHNGSLFSSCIWGAGSNLYFYKYKKYDNGLNEFYKLKHSSLDGDCDEGCSGYCCAKITEGGSSCWRRVEDLGGYPASQPTECDEGEWCPGH